MNLPSLQDLDLSGKRVLLRLDLDVSIEREKVLEDYRLKASIPTIRYLLEQECSRIIILGHRGRPGANDNNLSLKPIAQYLERLLKSDLGVDLAKNEDVLVMENLRFDPRESFGSTGNHEEMMEFARELAAKGDVFVNDAFGVSHRETASIVGLPRLLPSVAGLHLIQEVEHLSQVLINPRAPVITIVGGGKMDKAFLIDKLLNCSDMVLVGGVLPKEVKSYCREDGKMCIVAAHLTPDGRDITPDSVRNFIEIIKGARTIVWNGPMGDIDSDFWESTEIIAHAVAQSRALKIVGGGDTIRALDELNLLNKMDWVSTGGGAMLEFLAYKDLPGLKALRA